MLCYRDAWKSVGSMEKSRAMLEYIQEVEKHEPQWETKVIILVTFSMKHIFNRGDADQTERLRRIDTLSWEPAVSDVLSPFWRNLL